MRLQEIYKKEIAKKLQDKLGIKNVMAVPRLSKLVINVGFGHQAKDKDLADFVKQNLISISGQRPVLTIAKKAISAFKIREGMVIGAKVTLRGKRMWDFVEKMVNIYFPCVRDFRGLDEKAIDNSGNLTVGFKDILAFPELDILDLEKLHGLEVCIANTAENREQGFALFKALGFPLRDNK
jgi:large subunit ribosomal protein L5